MPEFSNRWSRKLYHTLRPFREELASQPRKYLEIGVFEGGSIHMMMTSYLKHPESRAWGVDPWGLREMSRRRYPANDEGLKKIQAVEQRARNNLAEFGTKVELIKACSRDYLLGNPFPEEFFDVIYVDGVHYGYGALTDSVLTWPLLKVGGLCVWDDYEARHAPDLPRVVTAFLSALGPGSHEILKDVSQLLVRKLAPIQQAPPLDEPS